MMSNTKRKFIPQAGRDSVSESCTAPAVSSMDSGGSSTSTPINKTQTNRKPPIDSGNHTEATQSELESGSSTSSRVRENRRIKRVPWTEADNRELLLCYYRQQEIGTASERSVFEFWRSRNPHVRPKITSKTLAAQRRQVINSKKFTEAEIQQIKELTSSTFNTLPESVSTDHVDMISEMLSNNTDYHETMPEHPNSLNLGMDSATPIHLNRLPNLSEDFISLKMDIEEEYNDVKSKNVFERFRLPVIRENNTVTQLIQKVNTVLPYFMHNRKLTFTELNHLIYVCALVVTKTVTKIRPPHSDTRNLKHEAAWKKRIKKKIGALRSDLSILSQRQGNVHAKKMHNICLKYKIENDSEYIKTEETLKQKIQLYAQRIRRYEKRVKFYQQNMTFKHNCKQFYRQLNNNNFTNPTHPDIKDMETYWKSIWEKQKDHNQNSSWIAREERRTRKVPFMKFQVLSMGILKEKLKNLANWKAPGPDCIANFWVKKLTSLHTLLIENINNAIREPEGCPEWFTEGRTILIPKKNSPTQPSDFRPITCLSVLYKLVTSVISTQIYDHLVLNKLLPDQQKGCAKGSYGSKELLLLNKLIIEHAKTKHRDLAMAWIDYRKAFDSVPHSWIEETLKIYHLDHEVVNFCSKTMKTWRTRLMFNTNQTVMESGCIRIKTGIFQGDSLSPLLFCMALIALSQEINSTTLGYQLPENDQLSHLLYMDDLKLFAPSQPQLKKLLDVVHQFSSDIRMNFGLDKCAKAIFKRGKLNERENISLDHSTEIKDIDGTYKYLGVEESEGIDQKGMKQRVKEEYYRRVRKVLRSELNARNKMLAIGSLAVPVFEYSVGILDWTKKEIKDMDRKTRKILTMEKMLHPRADVSRLYVARIHGGRGLRQLEATFETSMSGFSYYLKTKQQSKTVDLIAKLENMQTSRKGVLISGAKIDRHYNIQENNEAGDDTCASHKIKLKNCIQKQMKSQWASKPLHGQFLKQAEHPSINVPATFDWLRFGRMKGETESLLIAAQDQALRTKYYEKNILKLNTDGKCRLCKNSWETIDHIVSGCPALAQREYIERHDKICTYLHYEICKHFKINVTEKWYEHQPVPVVQGEDVTIMYNMQIHTDRTVPANKPDIIIRNETDRTCQIIDVAIPMDCNTDRKEAEKVLKYRDLAIEISRMWNVKTDIVPVIVGALGTTTKAQGHQVRRIGPYLNTSLIQTIALYGTAHILRRTLS